MFRGLGLCAFLTLTGYGLAALPPVRETGLGPLVFTLILGLVVGNLRVGKQLDGVAAGLGFASRWLLRAGIVLFGFSLTVQQLLGLGPKILVLDTLVVLTITTAGYWLGTRWLKLDRDCHVVLRICQIGHQRECANGNQALVKDGHVSLPCWLLCPLTGLTHPL